MIIWMWSQCGEMQACMHTHTDSSLVTKSRLLLLNVAVQWQESCHTSTEWIPKRQTFTYIKKSFSCASKTAPKSDTFYLIPHPHFSPKLPQPHKFVPGSLPLLLHRASRKIPFQANLNLSCPYLTLNSPHCFHVRDPGDLSPDQHGLVQVPPSLLGSSLSTVPTISSALHTHYSEPPAQFLSTAEATPTPSQGSGTEPSLCLPDLHSPFASQSLSRLKSFPYILIVWSMPIATRGCYEDQIREGAWKSFKNCKQEPCVHHSFSIATFRELPALETKCKWNSSSITFPKHQKEMTSKAGSFLCWAETRADTTWCAISLGISWHQRKTLFPRAQEATTTTCLSLDSVPSAGVCPLDLRHLVPKVPLAKGE